VYQVGVVGLGILQRSVASEIRQDQGS